jgi:hypothetical protein
VDEFETESKVGTIIIVKKWMQHWIPYTCKAGTHQSCMKRSEIKSVIVLPFRLESTL